MKTERDITINAFNAALKRMGFQPSPDVWRDGYLTKLTSGKTVHILVRILKRPIRRNILKTLLESRHQLNTTRNPVNPDVPS